MVNLPDEADVSPDVWKYLWKLDSVKRTKKASQSSLETKKVPEVKITDITGKTSKGFSFEVNDNTIVINGISSERLDSVVVLNFKKE